MNKQNRNKNRKKIAFTYYKMSSFVEQDLLLLRKYYKIMPIHFSGIRDLLLLINGVIKSDLAFSWFAWDHAAIAVFFSKLLNKKSIVVVGGMDAAFVPELKYGSFIKLKGRLAAKYVYKNADKVIVVDLSLKEDIIRNAKVPGTNIEYLPTGYNSDFWVPLGKKQNVILTVSGADDIKRIKIKGLDTFVRSAQYVKNAKFIVIGVKEEAKKYLEDISSNNIELIEFLPQNKLLEFYQNAKVYCQLSLREGLPNTLCEAMLCGCIPVGTKNYGIPTAIGDTGFYAPYGDPKATAESIKKALNSPDNWGEKARDRIIEMFPIERREEGLVNIIRNLVNR